MGLIVFIWEQTEAAKIGPSQEILRSEKVGPRYRGGSGDASALGSPCRDP